MMNRKALILFIILAISVTSAVAFGAECPTTDPIGAITGLSDPTCAAMDSKGNLYVTQNTVRKISVYNQNGRFLRSIKLGYEPLAIAVDDAGLYVTGSDRSLTVYDPAMNATTVGTLIPLPSSIAVSADRIYVGDPINNKIHVFSKAGQYQAEFGGDGSTFTPVALAVDVPNGRLYAVNTTPASVLVFDLDGVFISKFVSDSMEGTGVLGGPRGIVLESGRLLIADALNQNISVLDTSGASACAFGASEPMRKPFGLTLGTNKLLYVTDKESSKVFIIGIDDYKKMDVSPVAVSFSGQDCGTKPAAKTITVANSGRAAINWAVSSGASWISAAPQAGKLEIGESVEVGIEVDPAGLTGTNTGEITVSSEGAEEKVSVSLEILPPSTLSVSPASFSFFVKGKDTPSSETLTIELSGDVSGTAEWEASSDPWVGVTPAKGSSNTLAMASVSPDVTGLDGGEYSGKITVTAACSTGSPVEVAVSLTYVKGGTLVVKTNIPEASYTVKGPETYTGSGAEFTADAVPEGLYTVTFADVKGFKAPSPYSLSVTDGSVTEFIGNYKDLRKRMSIIASVGMGSETPADEVRVFDGKGAVLGSFVVDGRAGLRGGTTTSASDVDGGGSTEILASSGKDGSVAGFRADGSPIDGLRFTAFKRYGAEVASGDLNGDGIAEIVAGASPIEGNPAEVRVFGFGGGAVIDTGIDYLAYIERFGVMAAVGDVDGDGVSEVLTSNASGSIRIWKADPSGGQGLWKVVEAGGFSLASGSAVSSIAAGDIDGDGAAEIIVATAPQSGSRAALVSAYRADGTPVMAFQVESRTAVSVAAGDVDFDGLADIAVADGGKSRTPSRIRVYSALGAMISEFNAFEDKNIKGIRVSVGEVAQ